jgi:hypothetical protein
MALRGFRSSRLEWESRGRLIMTPGACCDMSGCIALFERIDPQVRRIETFSGDKPDTAYTYSFDEGKWFARRSMPKHVV